MYFCCIWKRIRANFIVFQNRDFKIVILTFFSDFNSEFKERILTLNSEL